VRVEPLEQPEVRRTPEICSFTHLDVLYVVAGTPCTLRMLEDRELPQQFDACGNWALPADDLEKPYLSDLLGPTRSA
jgi:hypothetical protein